MTFNFDDEVYREGMYSMKWEFLMDGDALTQGDHAHKKHGDDRLLPMWVADMDFRTVPEVIEALHERAEYGVFGYAKATDVLHGAVAGWTERRHGWPIEEEWITVSPGVVPSIHLLVRALVKPGEKVLIQRPVYHPFTAAIERNHCEVVSNSLVYEDGRYSIDFDDLAEKTADPDLKLAILCSPHNPVGRVWTREELTRFGEICLANNVLVIADEIHGDLIMPGQTFVPFASISDEFLANSITCIAPSKTFNLAGMKTSITIIADEALRETFNDALMSVGLFGTNVMGLVALETAYTHGDAWLNAAIAYIQANYEYMESYLAECIPQIKAVPMEGTYLAWWDCRELGLPLDESKSLFRDKARIFIEEGEIFGPEGEHFQRVNLACHRSILVEALDRVRTAVQNLS
ncbi:MAG: pyridoxal phosphate-dependent aminotransferase [Ardenticatenaceae bacterium]|nr:pyridoxal phosphate-dependent aminotransferase [Ardenticatenaceae bacterium]